MTNEKTIAIAGTNPQTAAIETALRQMGYSCFIARSPEEAAELSEFVPVLLLGTSTIDPFLTDDACAKAAAAKLAAFEPIVLLLDRDRDMPDALLPLIFRRAAFAAAGKRPVYVLARSIRSGPSGMETAYSEARSLGVVFSKYESISVHEDDGRYEIRFSDGIVESTLHSPLFVDCTVNETAETLQYAKALRLHTYGNGLINADRWFLPTGRTSRRGVYYLDSASLLTGIDPDILQSIVNDIPYGRNPDAALKAQIQPQKCAFCYTCYRVCPHGALQPDPDAPAMRVIDALCEGCGICAAICPGGAITLQGNPSAAGKHAAEPLVGDAADKSNQILAFCCENSAAIAAKTAFAGMDVRMVSLPCGGELCGARIAEALKGYGRVLIAVCAEDACRHFDGGRRACLQADRTRRALEALGLDPRCISVLRISHVMPAILREAVSALLSDADAPLSENRSLT